VSAATGDHEGVLLSRHVSASSVLLPHAIAFAVLAGGVVVGWYASPALQGVIFIVLLFGGLDFLATLPVVALFELAKYWFDHRKLEPPLLDEVRDLGRDLVVRRGDKRQRLRLSAIGSAWRRSHAGLPCIWLKLRTPGPLGDVLVFCPKPAPWWKPFARNRLAEDLHARCEQARQLEGTA
jgi:hypothetical protein